MKLAKVLLLAAILTPSRVGEKVFSLVQPRDYTRAVVQPLLDRAQAKYPPKTFGHFIRCAEDECIIEYRTPDTAPVAIPDAAAQGWEDLAPSKKKALVQKILGA